MIKIIMHRRDLVKARRFWLLFSFFVVFVLYAWIKSTNLGPENLDYMRLGSNLLAVIGVVFLFMQYVLSSRMKIIEEGFGLDRMLNYHRFFGRIGLGFIFLHFLLIVLYQWIEFETVFLHLAAWLGIIALVGFSVTGGLASTYKKLGIAYEVWKNIHLLNYILFPIALVHVFFNAEPGSLLYYIWMAMTAAYAALIAYRVYKIVQMKRTPYTVVEVRQEADDIWSLFFSGENLSYKPGQFLMIQLLRSGRLSSSHPFTLSSSPTQDKLSITTKELGDFTSTIKDTKVGDKAFIDAPYGVFSFLDHAGHELVFIAGGIGITPFMSMLRYMADKKLKKKVTLFWANKTEDNLFFQAELEKMQREMPGFTAVLVMSGQKDWPGEKGRINGKLLEKYLGDLAGMDFFVCGPPPMSKAIRGELEKLAVPSSKIHYELFEM